MSAEAEEIPATEASTPDRVAPLSLALSFACILFICVLFYFRPGGIEEKEESAIYALGWLAIPASTLLVARLVGRLLARYVGAAPYIRSFALTAHATFWFVFVRRLHAEFPDGTLSASALHLDRLGRVIRTAVVVYAAGNAVLLALGLALQRWSVSRKIRGRSGGYGSQQLRALVDLLVPLAVAAMAVAFTTRTAPPWLPWIVSLGIGGLGYAAASTTRTASPEKKARLYAAHALVLLLIVLLVFDPFPDVDRESHYYYLGPVAAILGGKTPLVDINCQYGVGVIYFIAFLMKHGVIESSMAGFAKLITVGYVVYYVLLYGLFLVATRRWLVSASVIVLLIIVCNFAPRDYPTFYPSVGPVRFFWGYLYLGSLAIRALARPGQTRWRESFASALECFSLGAASVWSFESFVYVAFAYFAVVVFDSLNAASFRAFTVRLRRVLPVLAAIGLAHAVLGIATRVRSGSWPHWNLYFDYILLYSKGGFGQLPIVTWTPWVFIVGIQLLSLLAFGYRRLVLGSRVTHPEDTLVLGATALGIVQFTYFLGRSHPNNLFHIAPTAVFVAVSWIAWCSRPERLNGASRAFRVSLASIGIAAAAFLGLTCLPDFVQKYDHCLLSFATSPREVTPLAPNRRAVDAEALIRKYSPGQRQVLLLTSPDVEVEALLALHKTELWPVAYAPQDALSPAGVRAANRYAMPLVANDLIYLDSSSSPHDSSAAPGEILDMPSIANDVNPIERPLFTRLRSRFGFQIIEHSPSGIFAARLVPRRG